MARAAKYAIAIASILLLALSSSAQVQVGDNTTVNLSGNLGAGYTGDFSNYAGSDHGLNGNGNADLNGFYYSPSFLSFDIQPFYNQSRANSNYQSVFQSSGVGASASIFGGSNFPGSVTYSRTLNGEGGYTVPGLGAITTNGDSQTIGLGWGINLPDLPRVSLQFTDGQSSTSIFGANSNSASHADTFAVNASKTLAGFNLTGGYQYNTIHSMIPDLLTAGEGSQTSDSSSNSFNVSVGHKLPLNGAFSVGFTKSDITSEYAGGTFNTNIDTVNAGAGFQPMRNLNVSVNTQYTNNLSGSLYQPIITAGGVVPPSVLNYATDALGITSQANYSLPAQHLNFAVTADHNEQTILGGSISSNSFHEMVNYGNYVLGGFFNVTGGVSQTLLSDVNGSSTLGYLGNVSYAHRFMGWELTGAVNYARSTQTLLIAYTSSGYGYSGGIGRRINSSSHWSFNTSGSKSGDDNISSSKSFSQSYSTSLSLKHFSVSGSYAKADGTSILTPTGLVPVPVPVVGAVPGALLLFGGKSYSFGASATPTRGLVISASYAKALSNTEGTAAGSNNSTIQLNGFVQYKLRQLWITGGYLKLVQGFSITGGPPTSGSSFYVGISRWFKFF